MIHVTNRSRWNRTKGIAAFICFLAAIASVGGMEDADATRPANYPLAIVFLTVCAYLMATIYKKR